MDQRTKVLVGGVALLLILIVVGVFAILGNVFKRSTAEDQTLQSLTANGEVAPTPTNSPVRSNSNNPSGLKTYTDSGFSLKYPSSWGILTCSNSTNFELDPANPQESKNVTCDVALKSITFMVRNGSLNCSGETVMIGANQAKKAKVTYQDGETDYRWCLNLSPGKSLDITHRVTSSGGRATSGVDYSAAIEEIIKTISLSPVGS